MGLQALDGARLVFYPAFEDASDLTDHFYRLHWFLHPFRDRIEEVVIPIATAGLSVGELPPFLDSSLPRLVGGIKVRFLEAPSTAQLEELAGQADCVLAWKVTDDGKTTPNPELRTKRKIRIDHHRVRNATSFYLMFAEAFKELQAGYVETSRALFESIRMACVGRVGYVFGTGPNLALAAEHDFSDGVPIVCNSMVRNYALMDRLNPPLIVIADPIFHAGPSSYAEAFRKDLVRALDTYGSYLIVPLRDYHIYLAHLPERFAGRIAAMPFEKSAAPNLDLSASYHVTSTGNVLTLFLLPLAATFFEEVRIFGCDGRPFAKNDYFWSHDKASQFNERMDDIQKAHPAFFAIDFDDYYLTHCRVLGGWVREMERGGKVVTNHTPSHIPALASRSVGPLVAAARAEKGKAGDNPLAGSLFVSIDPEVGKNIGHYTPMNDRMAEAARALGVEFLTYGNRDQSALPEGRGYLRPCFKVNSWSFRMRDNGSEGDSYDQFCRDLEALRGDLRKMPASRDICVFMYCGSFSALEAMLNTFEGEANVTLAVNLFYASFVPYAEDSYVRRWKPLLKRFLANGRNRLFGTTEKLAEGMSEVYELPVNALPYPSTTFDDDKDVSGWQARPLGPGTMPRVLFPGAMRDEKGFFTTVEAVRILATGDNPSCRCIVAGRVKDDTPAHLVAALETIRHPMVTIEDRVLDDEAFIDFLASGDIVVLPYTAAAFKDRPSGILIDTITLGRPLIAVEGTWLADAIAQYGWGEVVPDDARAIATQIRRMIPRYQTYLDAVHASRGDYLQQNTWANLIEAVFAFVHTQMNRLVRETASETRSTAGAMSRLDYLSRKMGGIASFARREVVRSNAMKTDPFGVSALRRPGESGRYGQVRQPGEPDMEDVVNSG